MGYSTGFGYELWALAQDLVCAMSHIAIPITIEQNYTTVFYKLALSFRGTVTLKTL
jgi:hypothetical protein